MIAFGNNYWMKQMNEAIEWNDWLKMKKQLIETILKMTKCEIRFLSMHLRAIFRLLRLFYCNIESIEFTLLKSSMLNLNLISSITFYWIKLDCNYVWPTFETLLNSFGIILNSKFKKFRNIGINHSIFLESFTILCYFYGYIKPFLELHFEGFWRVFLKEFFQIKKIW